MTDDPMARPQVDVTAPLLGGSIRLHTANSTPEALWVRLRDENGYEVTYHRAVGEHVSPAVRVTPSQARALADILTRYADSHTETPQ